MSATNRGAVRRTNDDYQTPGWCIDLLLPHIQMDKVQSFLEPCRGQSSIYGRVNVPYKDWCEIAEGKDYLTAEYRSMLGLITDNTPPFSLIITNPPFSLAIPFLTKSLRDAYTVVYLMRLNMLGGQLRKEFWDKNPPSHLFPLSKRPSFMGRGTDATEYAWFAWDRLGIVKPTNWLTVL